MRTPPELYSKPFRITNRKISRDQLPLKIKYVDLRVGVHWCNLYTVAQQTLNAPWRSQRRLDHVCKFKFISASSKWHFTTVHSFSLGQIQTHITRGNAFTPGTDEPSCSLLSQIWDMICSPTEIIGSCFISSELSASEIQQTANEIYQQQFTVCRQRTAANKLFSLEICFQHVEKSEGGLEFGTLCFNGV